MRIYYDELTKNIVLGNASRLFATGSLIAIQDRNRISIVYKETFYPEAFVKFNRILKQDGTPAGATIEAVITYLNSEFDKTPFANIGNASAGASYQTTLAGLTASIPKASHNLDKVTYVTVYKPDGNSVSVEFNVNRITQDVVIYSNISLNNHIAIIGG